MKNRPMLFIFLSTLFLIGLSCKTGPFIPEKVDPISYLPNNASTYIKVSKNFITTVINSIDPDYAKKIEFILYRSDVLAASIGRNGKKENPGIFSLDNLLSFKIKFDAAVSGAFPNFIVNMELTNSKNWLKEKNWFYNREQEIRLYLPSSNLALITNTDMESLYDNLSIVNKNPLPKSLSKNADAELIIWIPTFIKNINIFVPKSEKNKPASLFITGRPSGFTENQVPIYKASMEEVWVFEMFLIAGDKLTLKLAQPSLGLAWLALSTQIAPKTKIEGLASPAISEKFYLSKSISLPLKSFNPLFINMLKKLNKK